MRNIYPSKDQEQKVLQDAMAQILRAIKSPYRLSLHLRLKEYPQKPQEKLRVLYTPKAYLKLSHAVSGSQKEVGWHGVIRRTDNILQIKDILIYPQKATKTSTESDDTEYPKWEAKCFQEEEESWQHFYHGHSHVNMSVTPSGTDESYRTQILDNLPENGWYLFSIHNQEGAASFQFLDKGKNLLYEDRDIEWDIMLSAEETFRSWWEKERAQIKTTHTVSTVGRRPKACEQYYPYATFEGV